MSARASTAISAGLILAIGLPLVSRKHAEPPPLATTVEVQDVDRLWTDLAALQSAAAELSREQFLERTVVRTIAYLGLEGAAAERFDEAVDRGLRDLRRARQAMQRVLAETDAHSMGSQSITARREAWARWQEAQSAAADCLLAELQPSARHGLLKEKRLYWLLRLEYGLRE